MIDPKLCLKELQTRGVKVTDEAWKLADTWMRIGPHLALHFNAICELAHLLIEQNFSDLVVEARGSRVDLEAVVDGRRVVFEVKSYNPSGQRLMQRLLSYSSKVVRDIIGNQYGMFARIVITPARKTGSGALSFHYNVAGPHKVSSDVRASFATVLAPLSMLTPFLKGYIVRRVRAARRQLLSQNIEASYRVIVLDLRYAPVSEPDLLSILNGMVQRGELDGISGVMALGFDYRTGRTTYMAISNPRASHRLDEILELRGVPDYVATWFLAIHAHVYIEKPGWNELLTVKPGFLLTYRGVDFGRIM